MSLRFDSQGLFWHDIPKERGTRGAVVRPMPEIPITGWRAPQYPWGFPDLSRAPYIGLDIETEDPDLLEHGPGWARGKGHIVGISLSVEDQAWYFPIKHTVCPEENLDPDAVKQYLIYTLSNPDQCKIGANLLYDVGWLESEGIPVKGQLYDVQFAEALLSETAPTALEELAKKYLRLGKETEVLYQWLCDFYGGKPTGEQRANIYRSPPSLAGPYAEADALLPQKILPYQWALLEQEGLLDLYKLECDLIPLLIAMRRRGVRVDLDKVSQVEAALEVKIKELQKKLDTGVGFAVNVNAHDSLKRAFTALGIPLPTKIGKGGEEKVTFAKDYLKLVEHAAAEDIREIKKLDKVLGTFVRSYIRDSHVDGRIYCQFHPLRGDDGGTRSGRFASSTPNLQNVPSRDEELAPIVRGMFVPDLGHKQWRRYDYSQIEYRFLAHFAVGQGSSELRETYNRDPGTDYHIHTQALVQRLTQQDIPRKPIKNLNFGLIYGMGEAKLARSLGLSEAAAKSLFKSYHEAAPFARATMDHYSEQVVKRGYVTTILNRRSRFETWEPDVRTRKGEARKPALPYMAALRAYGSAIKRSASHKGLNRVLQGSAADMMKVCMLTLWRSGVFDVTGVPLLTVHDELDFSDPGGVDDAFAYIKHTMENCMKLLIPVQVADESGPNWGAAH